MGVLGGYTTFSTFSQEPSTFSRKAGSRPASLTLWEAWPWESWAFWSAPVSDGCS